MFKTMCRAACNGDEGIARPYATAIERQIAHANSWRIDQARKQPAKLNGRLHSRTAAHRDNSVVCTSVVDGT